MITEKDLQEAIAECQGKRKPNAETVKLLAACYIVQEHMYGSLSTIAENATATHSFSTLPMEKSEGIINYYSDSEFSKAIRGKEQDEIWEIIDELMDTLQVTNPRLYESVMRKLS